MHHVQQRIDPELFEFRDALIAVRPIELPSLRLQNMPGECVSEVPDPKFFAGPSQVFAPEPIVLRPAELIDVDVRKERAFDAGSPDELAERQNCFNRLSMYRVQVGAGAGVSSRFAVFTHWEAFWPTLPGIARECFVPSD